MIKLVCANKFTGDNDTISEKTENGDNSAELSNKGGNSGEIDDGIEPSDSRSCTSKDSADRCNSKHYNSVIFTLLFIK